MKKRLKNLAKVIFIVFLGSDTKVGQIGFSLPWILQKDIIFYLNSTNHGEATFDNEPKPNTI